MIYSSRVDSTIQDIPITSLREGFLDWVYWSTRFVHSFGHFPVYMSSLMTSDTVWPLVYRPDSCKFTFVKFVTYTVWFIQSPDLNGIRGSQTLEEFWMSWTRDPFCRCPSSPLGLFAKDRPSKCVHIVLLDSYSQQYRTLYPLHSAINCPRVKVSTLTVLRPESLPEIQETPPSPLFC